MQDAKARNIVALDLRDLADAPTEFFIICSGETLRKVQGITDRIYQLVRQEMKNRPLHVEGAGSNWMLMDYFNVVVHVFNPESRVFYQLDDLWGDAVITEYEDED